MSDSLERGFSVLLYQHFDRTSREELIARIGGELIGTKTAKKSFSFWTPHVAFFLIPLPKHLEKIDMAVKRVRASAWAKEQSCPTCRGNGKRHILVGEHRGIIETGS